MMLLTRPWTLRYNRHIQKEAEMFDLLLNLGSFIIGMGVGKSSIKPREEIDMLLKKLNELEEEALLNQAKWLDAEQRAETWSRRYNSLLSTTQTSFEE